MTGLRATFAMACLIAAGCMTDNAQNKELPMQAELFIDGGVGFFPGLARPIVLDENALSAEERDELARLVSAARAEPVAPRAAASKPVPDGRSYRIRIAFADGTKELSCADPSVPPAFAALMAFIKAHGHR
ncbi:hypothetical protein BSFA1_61820 (plasmid) [Burkholderia sp. SFA1]|uniref:protealysin inhibitor emfourin n=2 Tax=unclassified Caballeronia TaxID=2646786 RepID=UPI001F25637F|nr:protealysin inhibitor emfourin [Caballeronia sp. CLC5]MCE4572174.1 hypothetical protein [Caballeronia sp. CLC5]BBQ01054.1 hypothetical protein BSFA1_61820 [Burkholderia sp. SFA1]